jgi:hypothetical protein
MQANLAVQSLRPKEPRTENLRSPAPAASVVCPSHWQRREGFSFIAGPLQFGIKFGLVHFQAVVLLRDGFKSFVKVNREHVNDEHGRKRGDFSLLFPGNAEQLPHQSCARNSVFGRDEEVVKMNHGLRSWEGFEDAEACV